MTIYLMLTAVIAGLVQGTTGFGLGIVMMLVLPFFLPLASSAAVTNFISLPLCLFLYLRYRKEVNHKLLILPTLFYIVGSSLAILLIPYINQYLLKIFFSLFLIRLSIYFLKFATTFQIRASLTTMIVTGVLSGICDGLFGIGGPLMVVFYLALVPTKEAYLGSIQGLFLLVGIYNIIFRIYRGIFTINLLQPSLFISVAVLLGMLIANRIVNRINHDLIRQLTYCFIGLSGVITLLTTLFI